MFLLPALFFQEEEEEEEEKKKKEEEEEAAIFKNRNKNMHMLFRALSWSFAFSVCIAAGQD
ncbi:MAG: hypothetical protein ACRC4N_15665 [Gammaproteobacteria bacterium]